MEFYVRKNELEIALKSIKDSKALGKPEDECLSILKIKAKDGILEFTTTNYVNWAYSKINSETFSDFDSPEDYFGIKSEGEIYVDVHEFINIMFTYPSERIVNFTTETIEKGDRTDSFLRVLCERGKKGKVKKNGFLLKSPDNFEDKPADEEVKHISISANKIYDAVNSVEFASGSNENEQHLWGVQIEVRNGEISTCATDRERICYYDEIGATYEDSIQFTPKKAALIASLKNMSLSTKLDLYVGEKRTRICQGNQEHIISNVVFSSDAMPDWRSLAALISNEDRFSVKIDKGTLLDCIKTATLSSGGKFGIKITFNTDEKKIVFSIAKVEAGGVIRTDYEESDIMEDFEGKFNNSIMLTIDSLRDIVSRSSSDIITFRISDPGKPIEVLNNKDSFRYITSVVEQ